MNVQLSLLGAGMCAPPSVVRVEGESLAFVLNSIPTVGHRKGTARANLMRPVAELYSREPCSANGQPTWRRLQTARPVLEFPRADFRRVAKTHGDAKWWLTLLRSDFAEVEDFAARIDPGLLACGVNVQRALVPSVGRMSGALLSSLDALVIAMCWSPATAAGCFLASEVEPLSGAWAQELDSAMAAGMPWGVRLAELSALHGPLVRAWRWLWKTRPRWALCGDCNPADPDHAWCQIQHRAPGLIWARRAHWEREIRGLGPRYMEYRSQQ